VITYQGDDHMKIAVTAENDNGFASNVNPHFGRSPYFAIVDTQTDEIDLVKNEAARASGGAGVSAAQLISDRGVEALISGSVGPKAYTALSRGNIDMYIKKGGTVKEAVEAFEQGSLSQLTSPNGTPRK
jgi:predicted Fe-Mo cluster-binding NifX family protein